MEIKKHYASLSEAMRAGIPLRPQAFGELFTGGGSCALGAAMEAVIARPNCSDHAFMEFEKIYHSIMAVNVECAVPNCGFAGYSKKSIGLTVTHLNDDHRWTREQIADWLETEEEKLGYVTVSDEGFGSTQPESGFPAEYAESPSPASQKVLV